VLPRLSPAEAYVQAFVGYLENPGKYGELCRTTRERYEEELNWDVVGERVYEVCYKVSDRS